MEETSCVGGSSGEQFAEHPRAETRFAVCTCPSVDRCEWDRLGRQSRNIREAYRAAGAASTRTTGSITGSNVSGRPKTSKATL